MPLQEKNTENEDSINEAIFVGLLGIVLVFFSFDQIGLIYQSNILPLAFVVTLFTIVAFIRMLEIMLNGKNTIKISIHFFRLFVLPSMTWVGPYIITSQLFPTTPGSPSNIFAYSISTAASFYLLSFSFIYLYKKYISSYFKRFEFRFRNPLEIRAKK